MAEKAEKKPDASPAPQGEKKDSGKSAGAGGAGGAGGLLAKTPVLLGGVMIIEAAVLFAGFKFLGSGPKAVEGAELAHDAAPADGHGDNPKATTEGGGLHSSNFIEIQVLEFRAPNKLSGRTFLYDVSIYVLAKADKQEHVKKTIEARKALITDRVRTIIAQSDPEKLGGGSEPGLETMRRQVKYQLDEIVGEGMIEEVLVPRCIPFRTDY
jgi:flagellar basal body-associated protein FliL